MKKLILSLGLLSCLGCYSPDGSEQAPPSYTSTPVGTLNFLVEESVLSFNRSHTTADTKSYFYSSKFSSASSSLTFFGGKTERLPDGSLKYYNCSLSENLSSSQVGDLQFIFSQISLCHYKVNIHWASATFMPPGSYYMKGAGQRVEIEQPMWSDKSDFNSVCLQDAYMYQVAKILNELWVDDSAAVCVEAQPID